jgi:hypothetical protein
LKIIQDNMGGETVSPGDLARIKVPSGGGLFWTVTDADGQEQPVKTLDGIIVHITRRRAYWQGSEPSGDPPDCSSSDCLVGVGNPGGQCASCPLNQFGTSHKPDGSQGRGKACKETKLIFLLREGLLLPDVVSVPPASLKGLRQWQLKLGAPYWSILTRLGLEKTSNKDGTEYARIVPTKLGLLPQDLARQILGYANALQGVFAAVQLQQDDVGETDTQEV